MDEFQSLSDLSTLDSKIDFLENLLFKFHSIKVQITLKKSNNIFSLK